MGVFMSQSPTKGAVPERYYQYFVDAEGYFWHDGYEMDDAEFLTIFLTQMKRQADGRYRVMCQGETCLITAVDTPFVVRHFTLEKEGLLLHFAGAYTEILDPKTLFVGEQNVLYCQIKEGEEKARFGRHAYLSLTEWIKQNPQTGRFHLVLGDQRYEILGV